MRHLRAWIGCDHWHCLLTAAVSALLAATISGASNAAVSYSVSGSTYTQDFNGLPTDMPSNASIETVYTDGWKDDSTTVPGTSVGLPGWYLYHPISPASENGFNGNQRLRVGPGANVGAFWLLGATAADSEKALGSIGSAAVAVAGANMYMGLQLVNDTGSMLDSFTLTFDAEQWRDGQSTAGETLMFDYSLAATSADWFDPATSFTVVPALNYTSVVTGGTSTGGAPVDGNVAGLIPNITATIGGIAWAPGTELWLRWGDPQLASNADDGLAIDNIRFVAPGTGPSIDINSAMTGLASSGSTWVGGQPPTAGKNYHVVSGHTVTIDGPFADAVLTAETGGTVNYGPDGSAKHVPFLIVSPGGALTETTSGDFALGDISQPNLGTLQVNEDVNFDIDASSDFFLDMIVTGDKDLNFNGAAGSALWLTASQNHAGTIRFNGSGDQVNITESQGIGNLEMNSTGANLLFYDPKVQADTGSVTFNQPGTIDHASVSVTPQRRLHGAATLVANAAITIDLTKGFPDNSSQVEERRYFVGGSGELQGSGDITVNGTSFDPTNGAVTLNEFEVGSTGEPGTVSTDPYSGTLTANDYLNVEIRHNLPSARLVVNNHARLEMGHQVVAATKDITFGEVAVNNGGILEVGFEQGPVDGSPFFAGTGHHAYHLHLDNGSGRTGGLTLADGSTARMQVNGTADNQFDRITADGNVALNGTLDILVNPPATSGTNDTYVPAAGHTFDIISIASVSPTGDYNGNGAVGPEDYGIWRANFGTNSAAADGNGNGVVDAADYVVWRDNVGAVGGTAGTITGTFDNVVVTDPLGSFSGFNFQVLYSATKVQLMVVAAGAGFGAAVPEPSTFALVTLLSPLAFIGRRARQAAAE